VERPTAIIVDDEPELVASLRRRLAASWPELEVVGEALDGPSALELAEARRPDVAFLDIQMPGASGFEVARRLAGRSHVVFVTAYDQYAVQAFESAAVDYLLKPVEDERLAKTVARLKARLSETPADLGALVAGLAARLRSEPGHLQWLQVQHRQEVLLVPVEDVMLFQASEKYTLAVTGDQEWVIRTPLKELEEQLDPVRFWRVHRNAIVRVGAIARVHRDERGELVLHLRDVERTVAVSRAHAHRFRQM
jgi:DNA-binding LytR/AlgR family response regulator